LVGANKDVAIEYWGNGSLPQKWSQFRIEDSQTRSNLRQYLLEHATRQPALSERRHGGVH
jgi:hypothetical protein